MPSIIKALLKPKRKTPAKSPAAAPLQAWFNASGQHDDDDDDEGEGDAPPLKTKRKGIFETIRSGIKRLSLHHVEEPAVKSNLGKGVNIFGQLPLLTPLQLQQKRVDAEFERLLAEANPQNVDYLLTAMSEPIEQLMHQLDVMIPRRHSLEEDLPVSLPKLTGQPAFTPISPAWEVQQARLEFIEGLVVNNVNLSRRPSADTSATMARSDSFGLNWLMDLDDKQDAPMLVISQLY